MEDFLSRFRADLTVLLLLAGITAALFAIRAFGRTEPADSSGLSVEITSDGALFGEWKLDEDETIEVVSSFGKNTVQIRDGAVFVTEADCRDLICVHTGQIRRAGESIICLPNRLSVRIVGKGEDGYDAVAY